MMHVAVGRSIEGGQVGAGGRRGLTRGSIRVGVHSEEVWAARRRRGGRHGRAGGRGVVHESFMVYYFLSLNHGHGLGGDQER